MRLSLEGNPARLGLKDQNELFKAVFKHFYLFIAVVVCHPHLRWRQNGVKAVLK